MMEEFDTEMILLSSSGQSGNSRLHELLQSYYRGRHCDLELQCQGSYGSALCHRWILAQVSPRIKTYLANTVHQQASVMVLPSNCSLLQVRHFLDTLYEGLATQTDIILSLIHI